MVRAITKSDIDAMKNSKGIDSLTEIVAQVSNLVAQIANRPQVVIPPMPAPLPYPIPPKQPVSLVAEVIRGLDGKMTRVIVTPKYKD